MDKILSILVEISIVVGSVSLLVLFIQLVLIRNYLNKASRLSMTPLLSDITVDGYIYLCGYFLLVLGYLLLRLYFPQLASAVEYYRILTVPYLSLSLAITAVRIHRWFRRRGGYFVRRVKNDTSTR